MLSRNHVLENLIFINHFDIWKKKLFFSETESLNFIAVLAQLQNGVLDGRLLSCGIISSQDKSILPVR